MQAPIRLEQTTATVVLVTNAGFCPRHDRNMSREERERGGEAQILGAHSEHMVRNMSREERGREEMRRPVEHIQNTWFGT